MITSSAVCVLLITCGLVLERIVFQNRAAQNEREHHRL